MKRIFCFYSIVFTLFSLLAILLGERFCLVSLLLILLIAPIALYVSLKVGKAAFRDTAVFFLFVLMALLLAYFVTLPKIRDAKELDGKYLMCEGDVVSLSFSGSYTIAEVDCDLINGKQTSAKVSVIRRSEYDEGVDIGKRLSFEGTAEFDDSFYNKGRECFLSVFPTKYTVSSSKGILNKFIYTVRSRIRASADSMDNSALIKALTIGDRRDVSADIEDDFKKLGTSHILAISGLHLSIVVLSFYSLITQIGVPNRVSIFLSVLLSLFYVFITGFSPSLIRVAQMMAVFFLSMIIRRKKDGVTSLFFAGWFILLLSQWSLFNLGFLLSFFSTLGIVVFVRPITQAYNKRFLDRLELGVMFTKKQRMLHKVIGDLLNASLTTVSATVVTLPVIIFTINEFSLFSIFGNLAIVPVAKYFLMFSTLAVSLKSAGFHSFAKLVGLASSLLGRLMVVIADLLGEISPDTISLKSYYLTVGGIIAVVIVLFFIAMSKKLWALPLMTLTFAIFIPMFNVVSEGLVYDTALIDSNTRSGVYTSIVRFKGQTYLLDQTSSASTQMGSIDDVITVYSISYIDKAVFITFNDAFTERLKVFLSLADIGEVIIMTDRDLDTRAIEAICNERNVSVRIVYNGEYEIAEGITAYMDGEAGTAFMIENVGKSFSTYRSYTSDDYLRTPTDADIVVFGGVDCYLRRELSDDGHYSLYE